MILICTLYRQIVYKQVKNEQIICNWLHTMNMKVVKPERNTNLLSFTYDRMFITYVHCLLSNGKFQMANLIGLLVIKNTYSTKTRYTNGA